MRSQAIYLRTGTGWMLIKCLKRIWEEEQKSDKNGKSAWYRYPIPIRKKGDRR